MGWWRSVAIIILIITKLNTTAVILDDNGCLSNSPISGQTVTDFLQLSYRRESTAKVCLESCCAQTSKWGLIIGNKDLSNLLSLVSDCSGITYYKLSNVCLLFRCDRSHLCSVEQDKLALTVRRNTKKVKMRDFQQEIPSAATTSTVTTTTIINTATTTLTRTSMDITNNAKNSENERNEFLQEFLQVEKREHQDFKTIVTSITDETTNTESTSEVSTTSMTIINKLEILQPNITQYTTALKYSPTTVQFKKASRKYIQMPSKLAFLGTKDQLKKLNVVLNNRKLHHSKSICSRSVDNSAVIFLTVLFLLLWPLMCLSWLPRLTLYQTSSKLVSNSDFRLNSWHRRFCHWLKGEMNFLSGLATFSR